MTTLGQWIGKTSGTNSGFVVLNIELENPFSGRIMFADDNFGEAYWYYCFRK